jgi:hypothetical protein
VLLPQFPRPTVRVDSAGGAGLFGGTTRKSRTVPKHIIRDIIVVPLISAGIASTAVIVAILNALGGIS